LHSEELRKKKQDWEYSFRPEISETSKVLAAHYRERLLEETAALIEKKAFEVKIPANGKITHTDLLVIQKKAQKAQHEKLHKKKILEEVKDCSFRPQTNTYDYSRINKTSDEISVDNYGKMNETNLNGECLIGGVDCYKELENFVIFLSKKITISLNSFKFNYESLIMIFIYKKED
jgi:hypothetical protein